MSLGAHDVPAAVRGKAAALGAAGERWLRGLDAEVAALEREWGIVVGSPLLGGADAFVAAATTAGGEPAVLKLALPSQGPAHQIACLRAAAGRSYVRLLRHDEARGALLLERLGPALGDLGLPVARQLEVLCATLTRAWTVPAPGGFTTGAEKASWLAGFIRETWDALGRPCSERVVTTALGFAAAREAAFDPATAVLVHADAHSGNALAVPGDGEFRLIDPDGLFAEPACDLAVPMREWSTELLAGDPVRGARERCATLSRLTGVDPDPIWAWGFMERVATGLLCLQSDQEQLGRDTLAVAEAIAVVRP